MSQISIANAAVFPPGSVVQTIEGNTGGPISPDNDNNIFVVGDGTLLSIAGNALSNTLTASLASGMNGQLLIGATAGTLAFADLTSADGSVVFTPGANSLDLSVDAAASGAIITITGNTGGPESPDVVGNFNILGGTTGLVFDGTANTETLSGTLIVGNGGTGATSLTDGGIVLGSGISAVTVTAQPTNGQLLIGSTGVDPVLATLASADSSVTITNGAGTIDLAVDAAASGAIITLTPDSGGAVSPTAGGDVTVAGGTLISTVGTLNTVTFNLDNGTDGQLIIGSTAGSPSYANLASADGSVTITNGSNSIDLSVDAASSGAVTQFTVSTGTTPVVPDVTGNITLTDGDNITLTGALNAYTVAVSGTTDHTVQLGNASGSLTSLTNGTTGQVLTANTGADPSWEDPASTSIDITGDSGGALTGTSFTFTGGTTGLTFAGAGTTETLGGTLVVGNGGTGNTTFTAYSVLCAGTTATGAFQNVSGVGTAGQALTSNGAGMLPTWEDAVSPNLSVTSIDDTDSPYTVLAADQFIAADVTSGTITVNLPNTTDTGRLVTIKDSAGNADNNNITLTTPGGTVTIDGSTSYVMNTIYQSVTVIWTGTEYLIY